MIESLRRVATERLRSGTGSVVVCRTEDPQEIVWVGSQDAGPGLDEGFEDALAAASTAFSLRFLDGWYRLPAPPYQVWNLEVHAASEDPLEALKGLFELSRWGRGQPHVVGRCIYRAIEDPSVFIGFVGVAWTGLMRNGVARLDMTARIDRAVIWRPLAVVHRLERTPGRATGASVGDATPHPPFWARAGTSPTPAPVDPGAASVACNR